MWKDRRIDGNDEAKSRFLQFCEKRLISRYLRTYLLTYRVLLEKLTGLQLVKKFLALYGTGRFITAFTSTRHLSLS